MRYDGGMTGDMEKFHQYKKLAYKIANKFSSQKPWLKDEIHAAAMYGLWEATKKESSSNPVSLYSVIIRNQITYQTNHLDRYIKCAPSKENLQFLSINFHDLSDESFKSNLLMGEMPQAPSSEDILIEKQEKILRQRTLDKAISDLTEDQRYIIKSMLNGRTVKELSFEQDCSKQNIIKKKTRAIFNLKESLN